MSKIYLSYTSGDRDFVSEVAENLKNQGHNIIIDTDDLSPGQNWRVTLADGLKSSDVFVVFLSDLSVNSQSVISEIGAARAFSQESDRMLIIPVIIDPIPIPAVVQDLLAIIAPTRNISDIVFEIQKAIARFFGRLAAKEEKAKELSNKIEINAAEYIEDALNLLKMLEARNRNIGLAWFLSGFIALISGIIFAIIGVINLSGSNGREWIDFSIIALKSIVVVGLLGACSKYAFTLGKSYVSESLKSSDRMHAISFGKFYLRVYGVKATWPEVKDVFQHWNIDRSSSFSGLTTSEFDPKMLESLIELAKLFSSKNQEKK